MVTFESRAPPPSGVMSCKIINMHWFWMLTNQDAVFFINRAFDGFRVAGQSSQQSSVPDYTAVLAEYYRQQQQPYLWNPAQIQVTRVTSPVCEPTAALIGQTRWTVVSFPVSVRITRDSSFAGSELWMVVDSNQIGVSKQLSAASSFLFFFFL